MLVDLFVDSHFFYINLFYIYLYILYCSSCSYKDSNLCLPLLILKAKASFIYIWKVVKMALVMSHLLLKIKKGIIETVQMGH